MKLKCFQNVNHCVCVHINHIVSEIKRFDCICFCAAASITMDTIGRDFSIIKWLLGIVAWPSHRVHDIHWPWKRKSEFQFWQFFIFLPIVGKKQRCTDTTLCMHFLEIDFMHKSCCHTEFTSANMECSQHYLVFNYIISEMQWNLKCCTCVF